MPYISLAIATKPNSFVPFPVAYFNESGSGRVMEWLEKTPCRYGDGVNNFRLAVYDDPEDPNFNNICITFLDWYCYWKRLGKLKPYALSVTVDGSFHLIADWARAQLASRSFPYREKEVGSSPVQLIFTKKPEGEPKLWVALVSHIGKLHYIAKMDAEFQNDSEKLQLKTVGSQKEEGYLRANAKSFLHYWRKLATTDLPIGVEPSVADCVAEIDSWKSIPTLTSLTS